MNDLWQRLKQRKMVQWALAYAAATFALLQGIDIVAQRFGWPHTVERSLIIVICVGFFVVLLLAWYHGERAAQKVSSVELLILALLLAIGGGTLWRFARAPVSAPVSAANTTDATEQNASLPPVVSPSIPDKSIAVLPLANDSGKKSQQYFSDGLSENLIIALSQFPGLKVIDRNSSFQFRHTSLDVRTIGAKLGVAHLLEGSVQRAGDEIRISAELVNASDGSTVWSHHYDRPYKDLFHLQDEITQAVAEALKAKLLTAPGTVLQSDRPASGNLDAYTAYLRGNAQPYTEAGLRQAVAHYARATTLDPSYALAYAGASRAWTNLAGDFLDGTQAQDARAQARTAGDTALRLAPDLAAAHASRALLLLKANLDWYGALREARRAVTLAPNSADSVDLLAHVLRALGQPQQALALEQQALKGDPFNSNMHLFLALNLRALGRLHTAEAAIRKAIELAPGDGRSFFFLTAIKVQQGDAEAAMSAAHSGPSGTSHDFAVAMALQIGNRPGASDAALKSLVDKDAHNGAYQIAEVYALRKNPDKVFEWLDRAWANRDPGLIYLLTDPLILRYKDDPRFASYCRKVGLPLPEDASKQPTVASS